MKEFKSQYGPWALVTGASSGIGKEFASQLAEQGLNLVLVARRTERLEFLAERLSALHGVSVKTIAVDLTDPDFIDRIREATKDLDIGLVVNNAGSLVTGPFLANDLTNELAMIDLNVRAPVILGQEFGKRLAQRGRGGIIFVASTVAYQGTPFLANYAATKSHTLGFAEALGYELRASGVDVLALSPGPVATEMTSHLDMSALPVKPMGAEPVVEKALKKLGHGSSTIPGAMNNAINVVGKWLFPRSINTWMMGYLFGKVVSASGKGSTRPSIVRADAEAEPADTEKVAVGGQLQTVPIEDVY